MAKAYIFGGGGHARVIASFLTVTPVFVVQKPDGENTLSEEDYFRDLPAGDVYIGIGSNAVREACASRLRAVSAICRPASLQTLSSRGTRRSRAAR